MTENEKTPKPDNIVAAMDKVAEVITPEISNKLSDDDGPADKQTLIRATAADQERWKLAAKREGQTLSAFIRDALNAKTGNILDCAHPEEELLRYPWSVTCQKCGTRLHDDGSDNIRG
jgi:predicted DNA-binding protein